MGTNSGLLSLLLGAYITHSISKRGTLFCGSIGRAVNGGSTLLLKSLPQLHRIAQWLRSGTATEGNVSFWPNDGASPGAKIFYSVRGWLPWDTFPRVDDSPRR